MRVPDRPVRVIDPAAVGPAATPGAAAMSEELKAVLRDMGTAGYRAGYEAALNRLRSDPYESARVHLPGGARPETRFVLEQVHGEGYLRGMHDHQRGFHEEAVWKDAGRVSREAVLRVETELKAALREIGAAGYERGYGDAAAGRGRAGRPPRSPADRGPGDAVEYLRSDVATRAYVRGFDDHVRGASRADADRRRLQVDYVREVTAIGEDRQGALRFGTRGASVRAAERSPHAVAASAGDRDRDSAPSR